MTTEERISQLKPGVRFIKNPNYSFYYVFEDGSVYSDLKCRWLKGSISDLGYQKYFITFDNGKQKWRSAHQLVYECFISDIPTGLEINHKDGNKLNNHVSNLEAITHSENIQHSFDIIGRKIYKGDEHWHYGKLFSSDTKNKMSEKKLGINHPKFKGWYVVDDIKYESSIQAAKQTGMNNKKIIEWCKKNKNGCYFLPKE